MDPDANTTPYRNVVIRTAHPPLPFFSDVVFLCRPSPFQQDVQHCTTLTQNLCNQDGGRLSGLCKKHNYESPSTKAGSSYYQGTWIKN